MKKVKTVAVALAAIAFLFAPKQSFADGDLVTIIGEMKNNNRDRLDPFMDAFLKFNDRDFVHAYAMNRKALDALPQTSVSANAEGWPRAVEASGPRVEDILAAAGIDNDATLSFVALDGYAVTLTPEDRSSHDWILATRANGEALNIGGRGPTWLLYDTANSTATAEEEAKWVWSMYLIVVE